MSYAPKGQTDSEPPPQPAYIQWHHSPAHLFLPDAFYFLTAGTIHKELFFHGETRLQLLQTSLFAALTHYEWEIQAWALFSNHYHFIAKAPDNAKSLKAMLQRVHSQSAREVNKLDNTPGRQVWFRYWDTCLTFEKSYHARLNYVMNNPVRHGLVAKAELYPYCSASWFHANADSAFRRKIESFAYASVKIDDDF